MTLLLLALVTGNELDIRISKILAGQEAEKTNTIFVTLAQALEEGRSSRNAVLKITGIDPDESVKKSNAPGGSKTSTSKKTSTSTLAPKQSSTSNLDGNKGKSVFIYNY